MKKPFLPLLSLLALATFGQQALAQKQHPLLVKSSQQMAAGNFDAAVESLNALLQEDPKHGVGWFQLGEAQFKRSHYSEAADAYRKSEEMGFIPYIIRYPLAKSYAMMGEHQKAFETLIKATEVGFGNVQALETDEEWTGLRDDPEFQKAKLAADKVAHPCLYDEAYGALDFWIGDWDVYNKKGYRVATSTVEKELGGCAVIERWHSIYANSNAKNYTFYDNGEKRWQQSFLSERGALTTLSGHAEEGKVIFSGPGKNSAGDPVLLRLTFETKPDAADAFQTIDQSQDDGKTWVNINVLRYARKDGTTQAAQ